MLFNEKSGTVKIGRGGAGGGKRQTHIVRLFFAFLYIFLIFPPLVLIVILLSLIVISTNTKN